MKQLSGNNSMNTWNRVGQTTAIIAVSLICLSACGGGSTTTSGVASTTSVPDISVPAVQPVNNAPDTPSGVSAVGSTNKIALSWNAVSGATSYTIYWSTSPGLTATTGAGIVNVGAGYIHKGLLPAATYYYIVTAQNSSGESDASGRVSAATATLDGSAPYATFCAECHGPLATSIVTNAGVTDIKGAMQNFGAMNSLT